MNEKKIKRLLLEGKYLNAEALAKAESYQEEHQVSLIDYLLREQLVTKNVLGQVVAESYGIWYADLNHNPPSREQVLEIPEEIARKYHVVLFKKDKETATVATDDPLEDSLEEELQEIFGDRHLVIAYTLTEDLEAAFIYYRKPLETRFSEIIKAERKVAPEMFDEILEDALAYRASDIHFEPQEKEVVIRFRIDGVLHEAGRVSRDYYENILNRIKVQARLRIDEHMSAQDGAIRYNKKDYVVDLRVSIAPMLDGEKVVIRLLAEYVRGFTLSDLGLSSRDQKKILEAGRKPFGMIVVTGPTGAGKTTTLYALIKTLNQPEVNITTIEDPVEYKVMGVNQIQVNAATNLTFASGLRSIIRQDPNIILVGEIRDEETAEIAVNAALTGHLLLSTFHANDAATAIPRLLDMGVEPFLLASTLELIIAQRLVRRICESCRMSESVTLNKLEKLIPDAQRFFSETRLTFYRGKGCSSCNRTGYKGRTAIFEFIKITPALEDLILKNPSTRQIWQLARNEGDRSLFEDGLEKVKSGVTSLEELLRVTQPPLG